MIWHDYQTSISCEICSDELSVQKNLGENRVRQFARKRGWKVIGGKDVCPDCAAKEEKKHDRCKTNS